MKYIVIQTERNGIIREFPIIFPKELVHSEVLNTLLARRVHGLERGHCVSAGFIDLHVRPSCHGESESIGIKSRGLEDECLIATIKHTHGIRIDTRA